MFKIWLYGILLFIINCIITKLFNKWLIKFHPEKFDEFVIPICIIAILLISALTPFIGLVINTGFILTLIGLFIYISFNNKWDKPF